MRIWRADWGEGSELGNYSRARGTPLVWERDPSSAFSLDPERPPDCSSRAGVGAGCRWGVGVVEECWMTRNDEGKIALIIYRGSLSCWLDRWCDYWWWIGRVNYLRVLLPKFVNKTSLCEILCAFHLMCVFWMFCCTITEAVFSWKSILFQLFNFLGRFAKWLQKQDTFLN